MNDIGRAAEKCLASAAKYGEVIIITNSDDGWVHFSAEKYMPYVLPLLPKYRIVSARTAYEQFYPGQPLCWKAAAFAHEVNETYAELERKSANVKDHHRSMESSEIVVEKHPSAFDSLASTDDSSDDSRDDRKQRLIRSHKRKPSITNSREVISFGDSMEERTAVKIISNQLNALPKSVMFISSPTPEQLIGQLSMLDMHMKYVCTHASSLDLEISPQQAEKCAVRFLEEERGSAQVKHRSYKNNRPIGNSVPRMRRASDKGYDETFSL